MENHVIYEFMKKVDKSVDDRTLNEQEEKIPKISNGLFPKIQLINRMVSWEKCLLPQEYQMLVN